MKVHSKNKIALTSDMKCKKLEGDLEQVMYFITHPHCLRENQAKE